MGPDSRLPIPTEGVALSPNRSFIISRRFVRDS